MKNYKYGINDKPKLLTAIPLSAQHVLSVFSGTMSGAMMIGTGIGLTLEEIAFLIQCAMFIAAIATLIQSLGFGPFGAKLPIVSAGSYTFVATLITLGSNPNVGISGAFGGALIGSLILTIVGPIAVKVLHRYFTPVVTGSVVLAVGLCLMSTTFDYAVNFDPTGPDVYLNFGLAMFTLLVTILFNQFGNDFMKVTAILLAIIVGYGVSIMLGLVDFTSVGASSWLSFPTPLKWGLSFDIGAIVTVTLVHVATMMEVIGDTTGITVGVENRLPTQEELKRAIRGDGLASCIAALFNGAPVISGSPNVGIVCMTGVASRYVTATGGLLLLGLAFFPKFAQILALVPSPVIGGVLMFMIGTIAASGMKIIGMDKMTNRNTIILAIAICLGMGGHYNQAALSFLPDVVIPIITGISGTAVLALILNIILPQEKEEQTEVLVEDESKAV